MSYLLIGTSAKIRISPSAKAIFNLLEAKRAPIAVRDIVKELPYSERTIQYGLRQLQKHKLVEKKANLRDLRESLYLLAPYLRFRDLSTNYR
ncbi:MAG: hypothetical protein ACFFB5_08855 [Promethearchaeota archaeon]